MSQLLENSNALQEDIVDVMSAHQADFFGDTASEEPLFANDEELSNYEAQCFGCGSVEECRRDCPLYGE